MERSDSSGSSTSSGPYRFFNVTRQVYDVAVTEVPDYSPGDHIELIQFIISNNSWNVNDILCIHNNAYTFICARDKYFTFENFEMPEITESGNIIMRHNGGFTSCICW